MNFLGFIFFRLLSFIQKCIGIYNTERIQGSGGILTGKVDVHNPQNVFVGKNSYINGGMLHAGKNSKIIIGNNCLISYNVHIRTESHNYKKKDLLIHDQKHYEMDIIIGNDVWIGYGVQILPGIVISDGAVVGAGSVVTKNVDSYTVVAGVPARKIGIRDI